MCQSDEQFINILNRFQIATQSQFDIDTINNHCFGIPPKDPKLPYSFYTNETRLKHNESTFLQSDGNVCIFCAQDKHHDTCLKSFQLQNGPNFIIRLHYKIQIKKDMLVKLCVGNYLTHDDLVNGVVKIFQALNKLRHKKSYGFCLMTLKVVN
jgi:hypothetical protein